MIKQLFAIFIFSLIIVSISTPVFADPVLDNVHYIISGDGNNINALNFNMNYDLDNINEFDAFFTYYAGDIKLQGSWLINFLQRPTNNVNLELSLAGELSNISPAPAIGFSGSSNYQAGNKLYWGLNYFFRDNRERPIVYKGGLILPINNAGKLSLGFGNSYWYLNDPQIDLGFIVDF